MKVKAFRQQIVAPALKAVSLHSQAAENLLVATAVCESDLLEVVQNPIPIAKSFMMIEDATYKDCIRYLQDRQRTIGDRILAACFYASWPPAEALIWDMRLSVLIARVKYYMQPQALPAADDALGICRYYIAHYNSGGAATERRCLPDFVNVCK